MLPRNAVVTLLMALMIVLAVVRPVFVMYLCLKNTVADTLSALVSSIQTFQAR